MSLDIVTTDYALSNDLGYEGNNLMSGVASNLNYLIMVKFIGSLVIIMLMKNIIQKNENMAKIGMRIIIFMMLFVVSNNLLVINANALVFNNFSVGGAAGKINTANGYFDSDSGFFGYTGERNVYIVTEASEAWIFEPISYAQGVGSAFQIINSTTSQLKDAVVHQGYVYFIDGTELKKKVTRGVTTPCESTDDAAGGCAAVISTGVRETLRVYNGRIYYMKGASVYSLDDTDSEGLVMALTITTPDLGTDFSSFTVTSISSTTTVYIWGRSGVNIGVYRCDSTACTLAYNAGTNAIDATTAFYSTANYIYFWWNVPGGFLNPQGESLMFIANDTLATANYLTTDTLDYVNRIYTGGRSTIGLARQTVSTYETYTNIEAGEDSITAIPPELEYSTASIESLKTTYYNRSDIFLQYSVVISELAPANLLLDTSDYRWMVTMTDPNSVSKDVYLSPQCSFDSFLDTSCETTETLQFAWPAPGWLIGTWSAELYEINTVTSHRGLVASSSTFTVLNTTVENQSVINPPTIPITSGTAPQTLTIIDGIVSLMGLGVNAISKLLFAMIIIGIMATVGLVYGNGNVAMLFAFIPYAFFTLIEYIPKWIFIIAIILIAIVSRAFR